MKYSVLIAFALCLGVVLSAAGDPRLRRGQELIDWIEGDMEGTFIVMFYDHEAPDHRTKAMRDEINKEILKEHPEFHYYEVDVLVEDFKSLVTLCQVNLLEVKHSPTVMMASDGNGYWAHGQGAIEDLKFQLPYYSIDIRKQKGDIRRR